MKKKIGMWLLLMLCIIVINPLQVKAEEECHHNWEKWYTVYSKCEEVETWRCQNCYELQEKIITKMDHKWEKWKCIRKETAFQTGYYERTCRYCTKTESKTTSELKKVKPKSKSLKAVRKSAMEFLVAAKRYDVAKMKKCFIKKPQLYEKKRYMASFVRKSNKKYMRYAITDIKMKGKKNAVVTVSFRYQNAYDIGSKSLHDLWDYMAETGNFSDAHLDKYQYNRISMYNNRKKKKYSNRNVKIYMKKVGNKWKITSLNSKLSNAIHCNYLEAYDDACAELDEEEALWS